MGRSGISGFGGAKRPDLENEVEDEAEMARLRWGLKRGKMSQLPHVTNAYTKAGPSLRKWKIKTCRQYYRTFQLPVTLWDFTVFIRGFRRILGHLTTESSKLHNSSRNPTHWCVASPVTGAVCSQSHANPRPPTHNSLIATGLILQSSPQPQLTNLHLLFSSLLIPFVSSTTFNGHLASATQLPTAPISFSFNNFLRRSESPG